MKHITPICKKCDHPKWLGGKWYYKYLIMLGIYKYRPYCEGCNSQLIY